MQDSGSQSIVRTVPSQLSVSSEEVVPPKARTSTSSGYLNVLRLGRRRFKQVWDLQKKFVQQRQQQLIPDTLILVEHEPVYTLGKNADEDHLLQSRRPEVPVYHIERGGDVTYHGPGQVIGYPIVDLHDHRMSVSWYMRSLEEVIIRALAHFGISALRRDGLTGVWVGNAKIASLGVRLSRWVSMHGFALNVNTDLSYFDGIIPCGILGCGVTSMEEVLDEKQNIEKVECKLVGEFSSVFRYALAELQIAR